MVKEYDKQTRVSGYGVTKKEALEELRLNMARLDINNDKTGFYKKRRTELYSWLPTSDVFSIRSVCTILYEDDRLIDANTGASILLEKEPLSHYTYMYYLLAPYLSFEDFSITIAKEVDLFLNGISPAFGHLSDFPATTPGNMSDAVDVNMIDNIGFWCRSKTNTIQVCDLQRVLEIPCISGIAEHCLVAYGFAKLGIAFTKGKAHKR